MFFFSSRRRHTRSYGDWSSDVCSSDLLFVGREKSIQALDVAMRTDKRIMLVAQKQADVDDPKGDDLYRIATVATILQLLKLPDGTVKVLVEGVDRARIEKLHAGEYYSADATLL